MSVSMLGDWPTIGRVLQLGHLAADGCVGMGKRLLLLQQLLSDVQQYWLGAVLGRTTARIRYRCRCGVATMRAQAVSALEAQSQPAVDGQAPLGFLPCPRL